MKPFFCWFFLAASLLVGYPNGDLRSQQQSEFDICITGWPPTILHTLPSGRSWLDAIVEDYGATAVYLDIPWAFLETEPGQYIFGPKERGGMPIDIDGAITAVLNRNLNLYIRLYYGYPPADHILGHKSLPEEIRLDVSDTTNDFFRHKKGVARKKVDTGLKLVSFYSSKGVNRLLAAHERAVAHFTELATQLDRVNQLKEINPAIAWDAETEYPYQFFVGFSDSAQARFRNFLNTKYRIDKTNNGFENLLSAWGDEGSAPVPSSLSEVDILKYNWADATNWIGLNDPIGRVGPISKSWDDYDFPGGRDDWMAFRTKELVKIIANFSEINERYGIPCCIQIGSPFDFLIEKRGWHDITPLLEHVDGIRSANIAQRKATFSFEADLLRSVCNFWKHQNDKEYVFSTETNWPGYKDFDADFLVATWSEQLVTFYEAGSSAHFLAGWGYWGEDVNGQRFEDYVELYGEEYSGWRSTLKLYSSKPIQHVPRSAGVYLSTWEGKYTHGYTSESVPFTDHCEYYIRMIDPDRKNANGQVYDPSGRRDILTTFMLERDPSYAEPYLDGSDPIIITDDLPGIQQFKRR